MNNNILDNYVVDNTVINEIITTNTITENNTITNYEEQINQIHADLSLISGFLLFFVIVILCKYTYKFFNMFFVI